MLGYGFLLVFFIFCLALPVGQLIHNEKSNNVSHPTNTAMTKGTHIFVTRVILHLLQMSLAVGRNLHVDDVVTTIVYRYTSSSLATSQMSGLKYSNFECQHEPKMQSIYSYV
jgi:hypothetical protein